MADYPISNVARRIVYTGSAGVGPYAFSFEVLTNTDIKVYKNDLLLTLTTDYTVTISPTLGTGSVTLVTAATGSDRITIVGARAIQRTTDFTTGGDFFANTLNDEMDSQTILVQQVAETADRGIKAPVTDPTSINMVLPINTARAGKTLAFDSNGNPIAGDPIGNWRGDWASGTAYQNRDLVKDTTNSNVYIVLTAHTSSGSLPISTNADSAKWALVVDAAAAGASATLASDWAKKTNGIVDSTDYSSKAWSIGGTGVTDTASKGAAKEWATKTSGTVDGTEYSAKYYSQAASTSASNASTSASNASTSATNASNSATSAASAQTAAEAARDATLAAFDSFDDRYLGSKSSNPTLDNDGNALLAGALYYNTTVPEMRVYTGSAWVAAYVSGTGFLAAASNLSDLNNAATARTNLGVAIGTNVQAYDADIPTVSASQAEMEAGTETALRSMSPLRVKQAISANANPTNTFGFKNRIINGAMVIDQRNAGASVTPTGGSYSLDRWQYGLSQASKFTAQQSSVAPAGFTKSLLITSSSAYSLTSGDYFVARQPIEGLNVADLGWGAAGASSVTLSFWVRSSLTGTFGGAIYNNGADRSNPFTYTISAANTWEQKTVTIAGDTSGTWLTTSGTGLVVALGFGVGSTYLGTAGTWASTLYLSATGATGSLVGTNGATLYITGVQLEKGSTATSFDMRDYGRELAMCQRYYQKLNFSQYSGLIGFCDSTTSFITMYTYPVTMYAAPTLSTSGTASDYLIRRSGSAESICSAVPAIESASTNNLRITATVASGLTAGQGAALVPKNNPFTAANAYLAFSAEL